MNASYVYAAALGLGVVAGLRSEDLVAIGLACLLVSLR